MVYPTHTALSFLFAQPSFTRFASLLNATCFWPTEDHHDPHRQLHQQPQYLNGTQGIRSLLCANWAHSVFTGFIPVNSAFDEVTPEALEWLFANPDAAAELIMFHMLGPLVVTGCGFGGDDGPCSYDAQPQYTRRRAVETAVAATTAGLAAEGARRLSLGETRPGGPPISSVGQGPVGSSSSWNGLSTFVAPFPTWVVRNGVG